MKKCSVVLLTYFAWNQYQTTQTFQELYLIKRNLVSNSMALQKYALERSLKILKPLELPYTSVELSNWNWSITIIEPLPNFECSERKFKWTRIYKSCWSKTHSLFRRQILLELRMRRILIIGFPCYCSCQWTPTVTVFSNSLNIG